MPSKSAEGNSNSPTFRVAAAAQVKEPWSAPYKEDADQFEDFADFLPTGEPSGTPTRQLSQRQLSGQFDDKGSTSKAWEEDWDDEDLDDTFDRTMERIARGK